MKLNRREWDMLSRILEESARGPVPLSPEDAPILAGLAAKCARADAKNERRVLSQREHRRSRRRSFVYRPKCAPCAPGASKGCSR